MQLLWLVFFTAQGVIFVNSHQNGADGHICRKAYTKIGKVPVDFVGICDNAAQQGYEKVIPQDGLAFFQTLLYGFVFRLQAGDSPFNVLQDVSLRPGGALSRSLPGELPCDSRKRRVQPPGDHSGKENGGEEADHKAACRKQQKGIDFLIQNIRMDETVKFPACVLGINAGNQQSVLSQSKLSAACIGQSVKNIVTRLDIGKSVLGPGCQDTLVVHGQVGLLICGNGIKYLCK